MLQRLAIGKPFQAIAIGEPIDVDLSPNNSTVMEEFNRSSFVSDLYPSIRENLVSQQKFFQRSDCLDLELSPIGELRKDYESSRPSPYGIDLGTLTFTEFSKFCEILCSRDKKKNRTRKDKEVNEKTQLTSLQYIRVEVGDWGDVPQNQKEFHKEIRHRLKKILRSFEINRSVLWVEGLFQTANYFSYDNSVDKSELNFYETFRKIKGFAERNRASASESPCHMFREAKDVSYEEAITALSSRHSLIRSLEVQSFGYDASKGLLEQMLKHPSAFQDVHALSLNGKQPLEHRSKSDISLVSRLFAETKMHLTHLFLTGMKLTDRLCHSVLIEIKETPSLRILDLSDNSIKNPITSGLQEFIRVTITVQTIVLARNDFSLPSARLLTRAQRENIKNQNLKLEIDLLSNYIDEKRVRELRNSPLPDNPIEVYRLLPSEYVQRRFGERRWKELWELLTEDAKRQKIRGLLSLRDDSQLTTISQVQVDIQKEIDSFYRRMGELLEDERTARAILEEAMNDARALTTEMQNLSNNVEDILQEIERDTNGLSDTEKGLLRELREHRNKLQDAQESEIEKIHQKIQELESGLSELAEEVDELSEVGRIMEARGKFLLQHPNFQLAYGVIVQRLKHEIIGRSAVASGYFKKEAFQNVPTYQGIVKKVLQSPLHIVNLSSTEGLGIASGALGAVCKAVSIGTSGLTCGASLALEIIPIVLAVFTPILTATMGFGCTMVGKLQNKVIDTAFDRLNEKAAKKRRIAIAQAGSLTVQDQIVVDLAFGFAFHWQSQLKFLTEKDVKKFADAWLECFIQFTKKNELVLGSMLGEGKIELDKRISDIDWHEIPSKKLDTIFQGSYNHMTWDWLDRSTREKLEQKKIRPCTSRILFQYAGVRWIENGKWTYWSRDPVSLKRGDNPENLGAKLTSTRAWQLGYRTFPNRETAKQFIDSQNNHIFSYGKEMIDLVVTAMFTLQPKFSSLLKRSPKREPNTQYVVGVSALDKKLREDGLDGQVVIAVCPAIQLFKYSQEFNEKNDFEISSIFREIPKSPASHFEEKIARVLDVLLLPFGGQDHLFENFSMDPDNLEIQIRDLLSRNKNSKWPVIKKYLEEDPTEEGIEDDALFQRVMGEIQKARMDPQILMANQRVLAAKNRLQNKSPLFELIEVMNESDREIGCLLIPFTLRNGYDWQLFRVIVNKNNENKFTFSLRGLVCEGLEEAIEDPAPFADVATEIAKVIEEEFASTIEKIVRRRTIKTHTKVKSETLAEIRSLYPVGPISTGIFVANYLHNLMDRAEEVNECSSYGMMLNSYQRDKELIKRWKKYGSLDLEDETLEAIETLVQGNRENPWSQDIHPLGPPMLLSDPHESVKERFKRVRHEATEQALPTFLELATKIHEIEQRIRVTPNTQDLIEQNEGLRKEVRNLKETFEVWRNRYEKQQQKD